MKLGKLLVVICLFNITFLQAENLDIAIDDLDRDNVNFNQQALSPIADPIEPVNRGIYVVYKTLYKLVFKPIIKGYNLLPDFVHLRVTDFLHNLEEPLDALNHGLQLRVNASVESLFRFSINSTIGMVGLLDVATPLGIEKKSNDFGATLYFYGVPDGPYMMIYGPRSLRDTLGVQIYFLSSDYFIPYYQYLVLWEGKYFNVNIDSLIYLLQDANTYAKYNNLLLMSFDEYSLIKATYMGLREQELERISQLD